MAHLRRKNLVLALVIILVLGIAACTRSASTPPPSTDEAGAGGPQSETQATMDAVRSAILTQTAQALESSGPTATPTLEPTDAMAATESAVTTPTPVPDQIEYVVKSGDWIFKIAREFGVDPQDIIDLNNLAAGSTLEVGQVLLIPSSATVPATTVPIAQVTTTGTPGTAVPSSGTTHIVQPGEWIWQIARIYGVDPQAIIDANNLTSPATIYPGQELIIP
jgi:LysM repeat protein